MAVSPLLGWKKKRERLERYKERGEERMRKSRMGAGQRQVLMVESCCRLDRCGPSLPGDER